MYRAFPSADYYADSATPRCISPGAGASKTGLERPSGSRLYPYSASGEHSQSPAGHHGPVDKPGAERAAVNQGGIVAVDDPCPPGFGSCLKSRSFYHRIALALPFGLASTHAGVWQCRPAVTSSGRFAPRRAIPRPGGPQLLRAAASARGRHHSRHG